MEPLPDSDLLGLGFDILGEYSADSCTQHRILAPLAASAGESFKHFGKEYVHPPGVSVFESKGSAMLIGKVEVFETEQQVKDHFALKAGVKGSYAGFSGQAEALYGSERTTDQSSWYAILDSHLDGFTVAIDDPKPSPQWLADEDVKAMLEAPAFDPDNPDVFFDVFSKFGTHVLTRGTVGANLYYAASVQRSSVTDESTIKASLNVEYKAVLGEASGEASADWSSLGTSWAKSRQVTLSVTGGTESKLAAALDPKFGDNFSQNYSDWLKTIDENPKLIDFGVMPLSELFSGKVAATLDTALAAYLDNGLYVEARITPQALSGTIEVSGKSIDQRSYADRSGGAQLVVLDATSLTPVHNRTIYGAEKGDLWGELFEGTDALSATDYFCLFTVFNWQANMFPTGQPARWLTRCGATLESWERLGATSTAYVAYAFIGRSDSPSRQGLEQFDYDRGHETAFASVTTALVPARGGFQIPGSNLAVAAP